MAFPPDITTITVTGTFLSITGTPLTGQVNFFVTAPVKDSTGKVILGIGTQAAPLNAAGSMSIVLPCTDNANLNPANFSYLVTEVIPGLGRAYYVNLPHTLGPTVDLSQLAPVATPPAVSAFASANTWTAPQTFLGNAPVQIPAGAVAGDVLTSDSLGNASWQPAPGGLTGRLAPTAVKTAGYTALAGDYVPCDTTGGPFTVTLPSAPADLAVAGVKIVTLGAGNAVTIACAGSDVFNKTGGGTTLPLPLLNQGVLLQYSRSSGIWYVLADDLALSQLDARYVAASAAGAAGGVAQLDGSSLVPAAQMRPFNYRGPVAASTSYSPWDEIIYNGRRILATHSFTTGTGLQPFISAANYVTLSSFGIYYAADYGVAADGVTDDWAALQSLLILVRSLTTNSFNGFRVILPAGTIALSKTVILPTSTMLEGQGLYSTALKIMTGANCDVAQPEQFNSSAQAALLTLLQPTLTAGNLRNAFRWGLRDLTLHGNSTQQAPGTYKMCLNVATNPLTSTGTGDPDFDPAGFVENVQFRAATGDGYFHNGRSAARLIGCIAWFCNGNGFSPSFDTQIDHCQAGFSGIAGFYFNHGADQGAGCKSYNNGLAFQWVSGSNYTAGTRVMYNGLPYDAISALTNDTTPPASDPANWAPVTATSPAAWGVGVYCDSNAGEITFNCDCQENSSHNWYFHSCTGPGIYVSGVSSQPNFNNQASALNSTNPGNCAHLCVDGSNGILAALACGDGAGHTATQYRLRVINGSARCDIALTGDTNATFLTPDSLTLIGSGNSVRYNGVTFTLTVAGLADVNAPSPTDGQALTWNTAAGKWLPITPPSGNFDGIFGDGSDGSATLDGAATVSWATRSGSLYTMTRDAWLTGLTINSGVTLLVSGLRIFCQGTVTNNGTIRADGNNGSANGTAGAAAASSILGGGVSGGAGQTGNGTGGSNGSNATFGVGSSGAGGAGSSGTGGAAASAGNQSTGMLRAPQVLATGTLAGRLLGGGCGGGGGGGDGVNKGGGGGGGGGIIAIAAWAVVNGVTGLLSAAAGSGGTPASGNCGGGGGGGGGLILLYTLTAWTNSGTTAVTGGAAGSGVGTGSNGAAGNAGNVFNVVVQ